MIRSSLVPIFSFVKRVKISTVTWRWPSSRASSRMYTVMPPASFVRPGISSGDVWTLSIATEKLISTPLLRLSLIADAWPAPFVCFLLTYEHLFTPLFFLVYYRLEQNRMTFLFHGWFF